MKALILNSGLGSRMGVLTSEQPKCMTDLSAKDTILKRQLELLLLAGIDEVVMTTGYFNDVLMEYCASLKLPIKYTFVKNPIYDQTNYIYSIYCAREALYGNDIVLLHGDLVFELSVLKDLIANEKSCMKVSSTIPLPEKGFKAIVRDGLVKKVGVEFFGDEAMEAQALYKLNKEELGIWLDKMVEYCEAGNTRCYAEVAFNEISEECKIESFDVKDRLCAEIDNADDLEVIKARLAEVMSKGSV